jgi:hypothetical protein
VLIIDSVGVSSSKCYKYFKFFHLSFSPFACSLTFFGHSETCQLNSNSLRLSQLNSSPSHFVRKCHCLSCSDCGGMKNSFRVQIPQSSYSFLSAAVALLSLHIILHYYFLFQFFENERARLGHLIHTIIIFHLMKIQFSVLLFQ